MKPPPRPTHLSSNGRHLMFALMDERLCKKASATGTAEDMVNLWFASNWEQVTAKQAFIHSNQSFRELRRQYPSETLTV